ncbi:GntP family permease [Corynebacterium lubricantis]|uniref:GntP family permease n=1 Tax=Corynebacterium lubricantis TaxID=541095 RepID=UPI000373684A|nr:GntP family permease [Corynebacterium lubricantis]
MIIAFLGIILALSLLITLAYRGHSVVVAAPIAALVAVIFSGAPLMVSYFPLFLTGAIFGQLMVVSGFAENIARFIASVFGKNQAILVTVVITSLLTYGGVSVWVIAFTIVPIAREMFRQSDVSLRLLPATSVLGSFTYAMAGLPGTPQVHNAIPTPYFGTTTFAAPVLSLIACAVTFALGYGWLRYRQSSLAGRGLGFAELGGAAARHGDTEVIAETKGVQWKDAIGLLPIVVMVAINALYTYVIGPRLDTSYLAEEKFGSTDITSVIGVWSVTIALVIACLMVFALKPGSARKFVEAISEGARKSVLPVFTTGSEVGFGAVVASLAVFAAFQDSLFNISNNPLIVGAVATAVIAGITGSASGGMSITLQAFGDQLATMAVDQGISAELMHRVVAMASVFADALPHNGAVVTLLLVCGLTHRQGYKDVAVVSIVVALIGVAVLVGLSLIFT